MNTELLTTEDNFTTNAQTLDTYNTKVGTEYDTIPEKM